MKRKVKMFIILTTVFLFVGKLILFPKDINKSVDKILQKKAEQFYENQESFEKIVTYVSEIDFCSITENNEMWTDVIIDGIMFRLEDGRNNYALSYYPTETLLSHLMDDDENTLVINVIGEDSDIDIYYDKKSYNIVAVHFSIEDTRLKYARASLIWHTLDYEPKGDWIYPLDDNWTIAAMGVGY